MSKSIPPDATTKRGSYWAVLLFGPALLWTSGCATAPEPEVSTEDIEAVQQRVEDVERTNGRLMVRLEEMERQTSLTQDRVESNRIALQRRGYLGSDNERFAQGPREETSDERDQRPGPAPESHYRQERDSNYRADPRIRQRMDDRGMSRIPLSDQQSGRVEEEQPEQWDAGEDFARQQDDGRSGVEEGEQEELVITNAELERRFGPSRGSSGSEQAQDQEAKEEGSSSGSSGDNAQEPVTSERLPTTAELAGSPEPTAESETPPETDDGDLDGDLDDDEGADLAGATDEELLDLYQDSLAQYRAGEYSDALEGFTNFLNAWSRDDYVDNALYWIGECHYGLGDYDSSVDYFQKILDELPSANKAPDAMLKMSLAHDRRGEPQQAVELLETLTEQYPNSNPGRLGEEQLQEYSQEEGN